MTHIIPWIYVINDLHHRFKPYSIRYLNILGQALVCLNILTLKSDGINST